MISRSACIEASAWRLAISLLSLFAITGDANAAAARMRFSSTAPAQAEQWQAKAREKLFALMMGGEVPQRVPLNARILQTREATGENCVLQELRFASVPGREVRAWLARPVNISARSPGVLALHGHGGSGEQVVRGDGLYWYGRELVRRGCVVISPDIGQHELQTTNWSLMGERTWDAIRCLDYLESLREVDSSALAVVGLSLGGETAMYVGALDTRVRLVGASGWLTTVENMSNGHCKCYSFPGLVEHFDFADIFACTAPRQLICELGDLERAPGGFPLEAGRQAFDRIAEAYRVFGAETNLTLSIHPGGHVFVGNAFWPALEEQWPRPKSADRMRLEDRPASHPGASFPSKLPGVSDTQWELFLQAQTNAQLAAEAFFRCRLFVAGWLGEADRETGLIPRNLRESRDFWNGRDSAADNYPYMVLTASITDPALLRGRMLEMLNTETRLTSRAGRLPEDYSFSKRGWRREKLDLDALIFDGAEYVKDGLLPVTEWLGPSPWSERMVGITDDIWKHAAVETPFGTIPTRNFEVCGDLLQSCSRLFWFTGDRKYLDWAIRLGDYYLLDTNHPTRDLQQLRLVDHGCEVVNGLTELYVAVSRVEPAKRAQYAQPIREMFDRILEYGRNNDGLLYAWFNPATGEHSRDLCDTWGYVMDGFYTVWLLDGVEAYRDAVLKALRNLKGKYVGSCWGEKNADAYADSIEGAINLLNREWVPDAADWVDSQIRLMWGAQRTDGIIEGWHGDGNFARTSLMYGLWKTQGVTVHPWRPDLRLGATRSGDRLHLFVAASEAWQGVLRFDRPRHRLSMKLPMDYPRINQFPEWYVVAPDRAYTIGQPGLKPATATGKTLADGHQLSIEPGQPVHLVITATK